MSWKAHHLWRSFISIWMLLILLLTTLSPMALATGTTPVDLGRVDLTGRLSGGTFELTPHRMEDLFEIQDAAPGDSWKRTVHVTNTCSRTMEICIISCTTEDEDTALFDVLETEVLVDGKVAYSGPYGAGSDDVPMTEFFSVRSGQTLDFEIIVSFDPSYGNELQGKDLDSIWEFGAIYHYPVYDDDDNDDSYYTVYYEDEDGNELHRKKVRRADIGEKVTEKAIEIEGYTPDELKKSIVIKRDPKKNIITFVYSPIEEEIPVIPDEPTDPVEPTQPQTPVTPDSPAGVKTGVDLDVGNHSLMYFLIACLVVSIIIAGIVTHKLIYIHIKTGFDREEDESHAE